MRNNIKRQLFNSPDLESRYNAIEGAIAKKRSLDTKNIPRPGYPFIFTSTAQYLGEKNGGLSKTAQTEKMVENLEIGIKLSLLEPGNVLYSQNSEVIISSGLTTQKFHNPEAVWVFKLVYNGEFVGRIGVNFHYEKEAPVMSIATIQGAKGSAQLRKLSRSLRKSGEFWAVDAVSAVINSVFGSMRAIRGIHSESHREVISKKLPAERAASMYDKTFENSGFNAILSNGSVLYYELPILA